MKYVLVVKLRSREFLERGDPSPPTKILNSNLLEINGEAYGETQVEWVDGSQEGREAAAGSGYKLLQPSAWYVYGPAYRLETIAAGKRKAAARLQPMDETYE